MTTAKSPERRLRMQADVMAKTLKNPAGKIQRIEGKQVKFAIAMDDKMITVYMSWSDIDVMTEGEISDRILEFMKQEAKR